jgi:hypothetical protein
MEPWIADTGEIAAVTTAEKPSSVVIIDSANAGQGEKFGVNAEPCVQLEIRRTQIPLSHRVTLD